MNVGDYMLDGGCISVDRKYGLEEICKNLTNREDNKRFMAEVRRAYEAGIRLVVLVEERGITCHNDIARWRSAYTGVSGAFLLKRMYQLEVSYHVRFVFCDRRSCGRRIMEILTTGK